MYCRNCGRKQEEGQRFCPKCGEPFLEVNNGTNNEFKKYAQEAVNKVKTVNWDEKKDTTTSFIKEFINNPAKISLATKAITFLFAFWFITKNGFSASIIWYLVIAAMLFVAFIGIPGNRLSKLHGLYAASAICIGLISIISLGTSISGGKTSSKNPHVEFMEIIDKPETSYMVELPNRIGEVYEHTLIFFPQNQEKTSGRAIIEPWTVGKNSWLDGDRYDYEIRDNHVELFNGKSIIGFNLRQLKDLRFTIEEGEKGIQLRGMYRDEERIFKLNSYRDKANKEKHNTPIY